MSMETSSLRHQVLQGTTLMLSYPSIEDQQAISSLSSSEINEKMFSVNRIIATVYSGPTIFDVENALSFISGSCSPLPKELSHSRTSAIDEGLNKVENKYTLKIKTASGMGLADDGYKWRKYGQKSIKNSPNPWSYYKCTNPRCGAKKQVERSIEDPEILLITYEGLHLHFAYPYVFHSQSQQSSTPSKRLKKTCLESQEDKTEMTNKIHQISSDDAGTSMPPETFLANDEEGFNQDGIRVVPQGLLEDLVPINIRVGNPNSNDNIFSSFSSCSSSYASPRATSSSPSWPPFFPFVCDLGT